MPNIFFTADLHLNSKNIISYCNRPYNSVEEMNESIISNWNNKVGKQDVIYMLGDMFWGHNTYEYWLRRLNGQKHLILGNHDNKQTFKKMQQLGLVHSISQHKGIEIDGQYIWMSHYAHRTWNKSHYGSYMLYGHSHNTLSDYGLSTDVGIDKWNYSPVSFEELREYFKDRQNTFNLELRDNYNECKERFDKHFTEKYLKKNTSDAYYLENLIK